MAELNSNVLVGARARFFLNGQPIAYAFGVSWSEDLSQEAVEVLDRYEPAEYAITGYRVSLSCRLFRVPGQSLKSLGLWPKGATTSDGLRENILNFGLMNATVFEPKLDKVVAKFEQIRPMSHNFDVTPRGLVGENAAFSCVYATDEGDTF